MHDHYVLLWRIANTTHYTVLDCVFLRVGILLSMYLSGNEVSRKFLGWSTASFSKLTVVIPKLFLLKGLLSIMATKFSLGPNHVLSIFFICRLRTVFLASHVFAWLGYHIDNLFRLTFTHAACLSIIAHYNVVFLAAPCLARHLAIEGLVSPRKTRMSAELQALLAFNDWTNVSRKHAGIPDAHFSLM